RHRTVPTAVESIYRAADRWLSDPRKSIIIPPKIRNSEKLTKRFEEVIEALAGYYESLMDSGAARSDAVYLLPQAVKINVIRNYNAFNLLWPQGYVAMRTCSYAQWEERATAYAIWRKIEDVAPGIASLMGERCKLLGYCPEKKWCQIILKYREYNDEIHRRILGEMTGS
ncbi:MAG: FAD-dependent thymidylate synthase, partial [Thaumarchaeota archaeon]|nr:FAD-dependent thymidylate synthase [Nitrososphaerota archaeon]